MLSVSAIAGCSGGPEGPKRYPLTGTVTREGKPMRQGFITMTPAGGGPATQASITDGKYEFTEENGPVEGEQVVKIVRVLEKEVPEGVAPKDVDFSPETGFESPMPPGGWELKTTVSPDQDLSEPVDFNVDEAVPANASRRQGRKR